MLSIVLATSTNFSDVDETVSYNDLKMNLMLNGQNEQYANCYVNFLKLLEPGDDLEEFMNWETLPKILYDIHKIINAACSNIPFVAFGVVVMIGIIFLSISKCCEKNIIHLTITFGSKGSMDREPLVYKQKLEQV